MKKVYIKPGCFIMPVEGCVILAKSGEPEVTENIGAKESGISFENVEEETFGSADLEYDGPKNNLWNEDED